MIIEATFCMIATMVVLIMVMCFGFVVYQHAMMGIVCNQAAEEIAVTYKLKDVPDSSSVTLNDVTEVGKHRYWFFRIGEFKSANESKLSVYAQSRLTLTSLAIDNGGYDVSVDRVADDLGRTHYEVKVTNEYTYLFENIFNTFGQEPPTVLSATSYVADNDILSYYNTVNTTKYVCGKVPGSDGVSAVFGLIHAIVSLFI
jgi:hypothetical protein